MTDFVYCVTLRKYSTFKVEKVEVFGRTEKTVTVKMDWDFRPHRYFLDSTDRRFYDTKEEANKRAAKEVKARLKYHEKGTRILKARLKEISES